MHKIKGRGGKKAVPKASFFAFIKEEGGKMRHN